MMFSPKQAEDHDFEHGLVYQQKMFEQVIWRLYRVVKATQSERSIHLGNCPRVAISKDLCSSWLVLLLQ